MNCPICNIALVISERQGVEIDYCPTCRGVWLDRGELDKIIERSLGSDYGKPVSRNYGNDDHHEYNKNSHHGKKRSFLTDLFD